MSELYKELYFPTQPDVVLNTNYYIEELDFLEFMSTPCLFYQQKLSHNMQEFTIVPDGCIDVLFFMDTKNPRVKIYYPVLQSKKIQIPSDYEIFGFRIMLGKYKVQDIFDIQNGGYINQNLQDTVCYITNAASFQERVEITKQLFMKIPSEYVIENDLVKFLMAEIYSSKGSIHLNEISNEIGISSRTLRQKFSEYTGISPKKYCEIIRFQYSINLFLELVDTFDAVMECGYFDQAHLIKEYRKFGFITPKKFTSMIANGI